MYYSILVFVFYPLHFTKLLPFYNIILYAYSTVLVFAVYNNATLCIFLKKKVQSCARTKVLMYAVPPLSIGKVHFCFKGC